MEPVTISIIDLPWADFPSDPAAWTSWLRYWVNDVSPRDRIDDLGHLAERVGLEPRRRPQRIRHLQQPAPAIHEPRLGVAQRARHRHQVPQPIPDVVVWLSASVTVNRWPAGLYVNVVWWLTRALSRPGTSGCSRPRSRR